MQLVSFSVTNYRSITKAYRLPITQNTVLIGPNNEGKSNILRALVTTLEFLAGLGAIQIQKGRLRAFDGRRAQYDWPRDYPVKLQASDPGESVFRVEFKLSTNEVDDFAKEVKSSLNGTLPIEIRLGQKQPGFRVVKKGPGAAALSKKDQVIARFVAKRIDVAYIQSVRTAESAQEIVTDMVERALTAVEAEPVFQQALAAVEQLQGPVLDRVSKSIRDTLGDFLPNLRDVTVTIPREARARALRRYCEIVVDDGTATHLSSKGDGVQSLAALSLMRHASEGGAVGKQLILAIEEPESHLHPRAIHQLRTVLAEIAKKHQIILTTHSPLFVDRVSLRSNVIVHGNKAKTAPGVAAIRDILGVRAADNLRHAELILLVEGEEDRRALTALLSHQSAVLKPAIAQGTLGIESLLGGSNLAYKLAQVREMLCLCHSFLDNDKAGLDATAKAQAQGLLELADLTLAVVPGLKESEFEDLYDEGLYSSMLQQRYGVSTQSPKFKGDGKWSERMRAAFKHQGKPWSDLIEARLKSDVSELAERSAAQALNAHKRSSFDALVASLEEKAKALIARRSK